MKKLCIIFCVLGVQLLTGCNTVKGVGQDLQKAGQKIEDASKK